MTDLWTIAQNYNCEKAMGLINDPSEMEEYGFPTDEQEVLFDEICSYTKEIFDSNKETLKELVENMGIPYITTH